MEDDHQWKKTSDGSRTPIEEKNFQWKTRPPMEDNIHVKMTANGRQHLIEL
jgi:hypothetical protein